MQSTNRAEAERLMGITEKLLQNKDLKGCRDFTLLAQEIEPLLDGSDQILAIVGILIASDKKSTTKSTGTLSSSLTLVVMKMTSSNVNARLLFSDHTCKSVYDNQLFVYSKVDLMPSNNNSNSNSNLRDKISAVEIPITSLPLVIHGKEAYYYCWSYFPMGFATMNSDTAKTLIVPNTMPTMFLINAKEWLTTGDVPSGGSV
ncbi:hypothetical protein Tco_0894565 [Tanacetum coccineum]|uniref:Uncharacterized protein n=1 Tax=Tanacetum coccineum TaxID=301880 RepID=A0ABQ5CFA2_9ASTR